MITIWVTSGWQDMHAVITMCCCNIRTCVLLLRTGALLLLFTVFSIAAGDWTDIITCFCAIGIGASLLLFCLQMMYDRFSVGLTDFTLLLIYMIASLECMWYMPFWVIGFHIMQMPVLVIENMNPNMGTFTPAFFYHLKMKPTILNMIASLECIWYMPFWVIGLYTMQMPVLVIENIKKMSFNIGTFIFAICCHLEMKPTILHMIASLECLECGWHVSLLVIGLYIVQMPVSVIEKIKPIMGTFIPAFHCVPEMKPTISCVCTWCVNIKGGYRRRTLKYDVVKDYLPKLENIGVDMKEKLFEIVDYVKTSDVESKYNSESYLYGTLPPEVVVQYICACH